MVLFMEVPQLYLVALDGLNPFGAKNAKSTGQPKSNLARTRL